MRRLALRGRGCVASSLVVVLAVLVAAGAVSAPATPASSPAAKPAATSKLTTTAKPSSAKPTSGAPVKKPATKPDIEGQIDPIEAEDDCKDKPLETPLAMSPQAFER